MAVIGTQAVKIQYGSDPNTWAPLPIMGGDSSTYTPLPIMGGNSSTYTPLPIMGGNSSTYTPLPIMGGDSSTYTPTKKLALAQVDDSDSYDSGLEAMAQVER
jgi:hypothetical protein